MHPLKRVALINDGGRGGSTLDRVLETRGWSATRMEASRDLSPQRLAQGFDAVLVVLDGDDLPVLESLLRLSAAPRRPPMVLLTRRARSAEYSTQSLRVLGVDRLVTWPCATATVAAAIDRTWAEESGYLVPPTTMAC